MSNLNDQFTKACYNGDDDEVRRLLELDGENRIDVSYNSYECLRQACLGGHEIVVNILLGLEGDRYIRAADFEESPLVWACMGYESGFTNYQDVSCLRIIKQLLALRGDRDFRKINRADEYVLRWATAYGEQEIVEYLS